MTDELREIFIENELQIVAKKIETSCFRMNNFKLSFDFEVPSRRQNISMSWLHLQEKKTKV